MSSISIIICTYNPNKDIFSKSLKAISDLNLSGIQAECIVVDNNSTNNFIEENYFKNFLNSDLKPVVYLEDKQGLAFARIKGFRETKYDTLVFFDDDNMPDKNYIQNLLNFSRLHKEVGVFGAGNITVEFPEGGEKIVTSNFREYFQERFYSEDKISSQIWESFYPPGSGIIVMRFVFEFYLNEFQSGNISSLGRKGEELSSGEDSQIIWSAIRSGYSIGASPMLKLCHLIEAKKANMNYLIRLQFNISKSFYTSMFEFYPDETPRKEYTAFSVIRVFCKLIIKNRFRLGFTLKEFQLKRSWLIGHKDAMNNLKKVVIDS